MPSAPSSLVDNDTIFGNVLSSPNSSNSAESASSFSGSAETMQENPDDGTSASTVHDEEEEVPDPDEIDEENAENIESAAVTPKKTRESPRAAMKRKLEIPEAELAKEADALRKGIPLPSKTKLKISITKVQLTASWRWRASAEGDKCGICRGGFEATCPTCKVPGDGCPLAIGECKHSFHLHCIGRWGEQNSRASCPLCRNEWRYTQAPVSYCEDE